jgi:UDP-4-amino-4-deoxy-L-arabinose-oxoglutarate aminotransferase
MKVPFFRHGLGRAELERLAKVLRGPILTTGAEVFEFERKFSKYLGIQDTVACTSWTGAAHIVLIALGVGPGDECRKIQGERRNE